MKTKILNYINQWENRCYFDGLPDEVPQRIQELNKAPSYKAICMAIMKNDHCLETLGFSRVKSHYYNIIKRDELKERGVIIQLDLF